ncbi:5'-AMP-activated protein kinase subunit gamma [Smittium culicis]|uniref:5'-AMP-activated protein kinase subunit gamma n=1 Tax=Smittium culicis TaxID=133412 RepID=A0A1R1Y091_9FUNG|nr:5'-AMP-activated protein kinase subunit gamma [Smittium culicis]OMJ22628.1 5'-AMP-activated protein kinase subunit gamma [Smittium culicis]
MEIVSSGLNNLMSPVDYQRKNIQNFISTFLKQHNGYELIPISYRLTVFDTELLLKKAMAILIQNEEDVAALWDSKRQKFYGLVSSNNLVNIIQYYYINFSLAEAIDDINSIKLSGYIDVLFENYSISTTQLKNSPLESLYKISKQLISKNCSSIVLVDTDPISKTDVLASTLSTYQIIQFISSNITEKDIFKSHTLFELGIGTYQKKISVTMETKVFDVVSLFIENDISVVPVLDSDGTLINAFDRSDMNYILKEGMLEDLSTTVEQAIEYRLEDYQGVHTCNKNDNLLSILNMLRKKQIQRFIAVDEQTRLEGIITLSDILRFLIN